MPILLAEVDGDSIPIVAIVFTFLWLIVKALMAPFSQRAIAKSRRAAEQPAGLTDEEHASLLNLQRTLANMERRVESLETILIETQRTTEKHGS